MNETARNGQLHDIAGLHLLVQISGHDSIRSSFDGGTFSLHSQSKKANIERFNEATLDLKNLLLGLLEIV